MEGPVVLNKPEEALDLPPGFRFHPTDEEIITYYLTEKVLNCSFSATAIGEADLNKCEPWDLPKKAKMGENEFYFFCQRDRKYPTGTRTNRATESGYWKATGKDKEIFKGRGNLVGMKKTLVFYRGRAPKGEKTNWVMHEFRLEGKFACNNLPKAAKDEWVVSKIFHKNTEIKKIPMNITHGLLRMSSLGEDLLDCSTLPPLMDPQPSYSNTTTNNLRYSDDDFKGTTSNPSPLPGSAKLSPDGYYLPNFSANNLQRLMTRPEDRRNYEFPTVNNSYTANQLMNYSSSQPQMIRNPSFSFQQDTFQNYFQQGSGFGGNDEDIVKEIAAKNDYSISGLDKQPKMEQLSSTNQSVVSASQDTGLSNDRNTETSSAVSKMVEMRNNRAFYENLDEDPSSVNPLSDLEYLWNDCL